MESLATVNLRFDFDSVSLWTAWGSRIVVFGRFSDGRA